MSATDYGRVRSIEKLVRALDAEQVDPIFRDAEVIYEANAVVFRWPDNDDLSIEINSVVTSAAAHGLTVRVGREREDLWIALDSPTATNKGGAA